MSWLISCHGSVKHATHILAVSRRRTDNAMAKWIKGQTTVNKTID
jgi:hypothetical protein